MSESPTTGVVDGNCRVHGVGNLYMGGSSVFASAGISNPTYTIVQLALRLADRLNAQL
jgi:choline dehydrogenase-like flavoprotein